MTVVLIVLLTACSTLTNETRNPRSPRMKAEVAESHLNNKSRTIIRQNRVAPVPGIDTLTLLQVVS